MILFSALRWFFSSWCLTAWSLWRGCGFGCLLWFCSVWRSRRWFRCCRSCCCRFGGCLGRSSGLILAGFWSGFRRFGNSLRFSFKWPHKEVKYPPIKKLSELLLTITVAIMTPVNEMYNSMLRPGFGPESRDWESLMLDLATPPELYTPFICLIYYLLLSFNGSKAPR